MKNKLQQYFPMIQTRETILSQIQNNYDLKTTYDDWEQAEQEAFLNRCTGVVGFKLLYDAFFKEVMSPEYTPERLSEFLSLILKREVTVLHVIPLEGARFGDEKSLILMDIVVRLDDGSTANLEIQKIGYRFPGQRSACYSSDLLLRQYKKVRGRKGKKFVYQDVKPVYTIVLFEKSPREFKEYPNTYMHYSEQKTDTGLQIELLQKYVFVPLDIFKKVLHNKGINNKLEAWLTFLCEDDPEWIIEICNRYPAFKAMYEQVYDMCLNVERMMEMWSKELLQIDRNTVQFMIDEMQDTINQQNEQLAQKKDELIQKSEQLAQKKEQLVEKDKQLVLSDLLTQRLIEDGRTDDLLKASKDESFKKQLFIEYGLK